MSPHREFVYTEERSKKPGNLAPACLDDHPIYSDFYATKDGQVAARCLRCRKTVTRSVSLFGDLELAAE